MKKIILLVFLAVPITAMTQQARPSQGFVMTSVALYQPDAVLKERLGDVAPLSSYLRELQSEAARVFVSVPKSSGVTGSIVVAVKPGGLSRFWLVLGSSRLPPGFEAALVARLAAVKSMSVKGGPVAVALNFDAWGGGQPILTGGEHVPIPNEWRTAMKGKPAGVLPDAPLQVLWP